MKVNLNCTTLLIKNTYAINMMKKFKNKFEISRKTIHVEGMKKLEKKVDGNKNKNDNREKQGKR